MSEEGGVQQLGNYRLIKKLGAGGMGAVFLAEDTIAQRKVALKILPKKLATSNPDFIQRFRREAQAMGKLNHQNIVAAFAVGEEQGHNYYAMEYCDGEPLDALLKREKFLKPERAVEIVTQVAHGLQHAHKYNLIHRDIKPANVFITSEGVAKILDLGLSKNIEEQDTAYLTQAGHAVGTPHYISPEQAKGAADIDGATDIYSLGATFYHLVTGQTPFDGKTSAVVMTKHLTEQLPNPQDIREEIPDGVVHVIVKMMAKDRKDRYTNCSELIDDLDAVAAGHSPSSHALEAVKSSVALRRVVMPPPRTKYDSSPRHSIPAKGTGRHETIRGSTVVHDAIGIHRGGTLSPQRKFMLMGVGSAVLMVFFVVYVQRTTPKATSEIAAPVTVNGSGGATPALPNASGAPARQQKAPEPQPVQIAVLRENNEVSSKRLDGHTKVVTTVAFSPDGRYVLSGSEDLMLRVWDVESGQTIKMLQHYSAVTSAVFSSDGRFILSGSWDHHQRWWDVSSGKEIRRMAPGKHKVLASVALSPDDKLAVSGGADKYMFIRNVADGEELCRTPMLPDGITSVAFHPGGKLAAAGLRDNTIRLYDAATCQQVRRFDGHQSTVSCVAFSPDGTRMLSSSMDSTVMVWDVATGKRLQRFGGHQKEAVLGTAFLPDGQHAISGGADKMVRIWNINTGAEVLSFGGHTNHVTSIAVSRDGKRAASGSRDKTVRVWALPQQFHQPAKASENQADGEWQDLFNGKDLSQWKTHKGDWKVEDGVVVVTPNPQIGAASSTMDNFDNFEFTCSIFLGAYAEFFVWDRDHYFPMHTPKRTWTEIRIVSIGGEVTATANGTPLQMIGAKGNTKKGPLCIFVGTAQSKLKNMRIRALKE
jgi:eukaryotic-like serine/threonine-protein kinase